jgi:hypothetical protein
MSRIPTPISPRKDVFLTLRVTQAFRDDLAVLAEESLRSVSSQAFYYIQLGMQCEARLNMAAEPPEAP